MKLFTRIREWYAGHKHKHVFRVLLNKYFIVSFIFLVSIAFFDQNNVIVWAKTRIKLQSQRSQIEYYRREIESTKQRMEQLSSQKDSLEKFAREEYMFHESDEDIYIVE